MIQWNEIEKQIIFFSEFVIKKSQILQINNKIYSLQMSVELMQKYMKNKWKLKAFSTGIR